ncbi:3-isopropylmalate dehydrogenase [Denitratimonas tolerans]|uniref:3-isopropylmalate dehydrogenase n=1 Tax=Denitratimonas tolerans TaxID=1338420 RepID=A0AAW9R877_9GAMM
MKATIALLPGDGIGPEVVAQARILLDAIAARFGHTFTIEEGLIGGIAIDETGDPLPPETVALCERADAVLLGAVGGPKWSDPNAPVRPEQGLLKLRATLGVYANLRPVAPHPAAAKFAPLKPELLEGVDLLFVRELTGGAYFGEKGREDNGRVAFDVARYSVEEIERVTRRAAQLARGRRKKITHVDKANVLETSRLWRSVVTRVFGDEFPDIEFEHVLVDAMTMHLLHRPASFDVILTENLFGDILTDEASVLAGSMGLLPSASIGDGRAGLYEPIHGSAPDIAGQGIANPYATLLSVALLLRHSLGLDAEARAVESAVSQALDAGVLTRDLTAEGAVSTSQAGEYVAARVREAA